MYYLVRNGHRFWESWSFCFQYLEIVVQGADRQNPNRFALMPLLKPESMDNTISGVAGICINTFIVMLKQVTPTTPSQNPMRDPLWHSQWIVGSRGRYSWLLVAAVVPQSKLNKDHICEQQLFLGQNLSWIISATNNHSVVKASHRSYQWPKSIPRSKNHTICHQQSPT